MPVSLEVTAPDTDVIHSWWIPALGGKIDAIPGVTNETWFQAKNEGTYTGQCAELCGLEHAQMLASVEVMSSDEFDAWLERAARRAGRGVGRARPGGVGGRLREVPRAERRRRHRPAHRRLPHAHRSQTRSRASSATGRGTMPAVGSGWTDEQIAVLLDYLTENPPSGS